MIVRTMLIMMLGHNNNGYNNNDNDVVAILNDMVADNVVWTHPTIFMRQQDLHTSCLELMKLFNINQWMYAYTYMHISAYMCLIVKFVFN